jgi:hypothetical protein
MTAKPQFASAKQCFRKRNGGMRKCAILLENLFLIRIGSRDPGPHILAKQRLVGAGGEPLALSNFQNGGGDTFFGGDGLSFFSVLGLY